MEAKKRKQNNKKMEWMNQKFQKGIFFVNSG